jgi:hypothetical protein
LRGNDRSASPEVRTLGVNDKDRAEKLLRGVAGKRLTYR